MSTSTTNLSASDSFLRRMGQKTLAFLRYSGGFALLAQQTIREIFIPPFYLRLVIQQFYAIGVQSFLLVIVTAFATGSVMALQFGWGLAKFGGTLYLPKVISLSILREMGPVFTSLLVAGRVGSGIAAEVASMNVTQQIDAIRALGTSPVKKIVIPRLLACMICLPILTLIADYIGMYGGMLVSYFEFNMSFEFFTSKVLETLKISDIWTGMLKTSVFAFFISITACWKGLHTEGGTQGVGLSTTWVVVTSSIFIMISDYFLTKIFIMTVYSRSG